MGMILVSNLGKAYKQYPNRWSRLLEWITPGKTKRHELKWVLQDINFTVNAGEAVGIIGINGAGKSTLLKLITGTTQPTTGKVHMTGRVAAMLELGMGFHPDFTGRQNAIMAGQLLGMSSEEITRLMPEIEAFAEIGDYLDQPVRMYSSGMQMRLAFSVATAIRPDILIVDEALSVGDAHFQHKSFELIREFRQLGTTLLIVSHDKQAIQSICDRAILLSAGHLAMQGKPEAVMDYYNAMLADSTARSIQMRNTTHGHTELVSGSGEAQIYLLDIINKHGEKIETVFVGEPVRLSASMKINVSQEKLVFGYMIKDRLGNAVFGTTSEDCGLRILNLVAGESVKINIDFFANLGPGTYSISTAIARSKQHVDGNLEWRDRASIFTVVNNQGSDFVGVNWMSPIVTIERN
jgi:lipopolysaccharide transport system ATP-binding protein